MTLLQALDKLYSAEITLEWYDFWMVFGHKVGDKLWQKYQKYDYSLVRLFGILSPHNRRQLAKYLETI